MGPPGFCRAQRSRDDRPRCSDLRGGRGMGMALAAELNSYPGPAHVLELASALDLSEAQRGRTQALFEEMQKAAMPLGNEVLAKETELDEAFASGRIDDADLHRILADIGRLQGELRYTHLKYHLAVRGLLSRDQIAAYDRFRGYDTACSAAIWIGSERQSGWESGV